MAVNPMLVLQLMRQSPQMARILKSLITNRQYDPGLMADNIMKDVATSVDINTDSDDSFLKSFLLNDRDALDSVKGTQPYLRDFLGKPEPFPSARYDGPSLDSLNHYALFPNALANWYSDDDSMFGTAMRLGSNDIRNDMLNSDDPFMLDMIKNPKRVFDLQNLYDNAMASNIVPDPVKYRR